MDLCRHLQASNQKLSCGGKGLSRDDRLANQC
jgi:hypothetical protein